MIYEFAHATGGGVNHDWLADEVDVNRKNFARVITGLGFCGSTAAYDAAMDLFVGGVKMGRFRNVAAGAPTKDHMKTTAIPVPPNSLIEMKVVTDTTTNAANIAIETVP